MISLVNANLSLGSKLILQNVSCSIASDAKMGLVGVNGAGKSTLLRVIAGELPLDSGSVSIVASGKLAYVPQQESFQSSLTVMEQVKAAYERFSALQKEHAQLEFQLEQGSATVAQLDRYAELCALLEQFDAHAIEQETLAVLRGLGFSDERMSMRVDQLSVGWAMRVYLAQLLLSKADFYLFDEPTNHLDMDCCRWFIQYLQKASFGFILVSHDRSVLNAACERICEIDNGSLTFYKGNYDAYELQKEEHLNKIQLAYTQQQKEITRKKLLIERFRASATKARMAQGLIRELDQMERIVLPKKVPEVSFSFAKPPRCERCVVQVSNLAYAFEQKRIFSSVNFAIERGWKVALVAPNGVGKSTLLRILMGKYAVQSGRIIMGQGVKVGYFDQDQAASLDASRSILDNVLAATPVGEQQARTILGSFLFPGDDVNKRVGVLSGGEKNRVGMVQVLLQGANFLILDEPTNHLDLLSKDVLLKALQAYEGTLLFVSHDAYFVNRLATHVLELTSEGTRLFHGNYDDYCAHEGATISIVSRVPEATEVQQQDDFPQQKASISQADRKQLQKQARSFELKIASTERKIAEHGEQLSNVAYGTSEFDQLTQRLASLQETLHDLSERWEQVQQAIDMAEG